MENHQNGSRDVFNSETVYSILGAWPVVDPGIRGPEAKILKGGYLTEVGTQAI